LSFANTFSLCFPEVPGFCPGPYPKVDQLDSVLPRSCYTHLKQKRPCQYPLPLRNLNALTQQEAVNGLSSSLFQIYIYVYTHTYMHMYIDISKGRNVLG
jgi:hypothetical protein